MQKPADEIFPHIARMSSDQNIQRFKHAYLVCTRILSVFCLLSIPGALFSNPSGFGGQVLVASALIAFPWVPIRLRGGLLGNLRLAVIFSVILAMVLGSFQILVFCEFVRSGGGEGPKGEGSPGAMICAMIFFAALFFCPWLITALRGLSLWHNPRRNNLAEG